MIRAVLFLVVVAGCDKKPRPVTSSSGSAIAGDAAVAPIAIDAPVAVIAADAADLPIPTLDAGPEDYSNLVTAEWPTAMEIVEIETPADDGTHNHYRFKTRPPDLGNAMNLVFKKFADLAKSKRTWELHCFLSTASRIAIVGFCRHMNKMDESGGGAPAGPEPEYFARWMQPGLPHIRAEHIAPGVDFKALFAQTYAAAPKDCPLDHCKFVPEAFRIDDEGLTFEPAEYCYPDCLRPNVPLEDLKPTHPWGKKLVEFLRQQVEKGEPVVKYVVKAS